MKKDVYEEISRSIVRLLLKEPFYGHLFSGLIRNITEEIPTLAVGMTNSMPALYINPVFFTKKLKAEERISVIKHEVLHLVFKHVLRFVESKYDIELYNIAADLVVNQFIAPWKLPDSAVTIEKFQDLKMEKNQTIKYYYNKLLQFAKKSSLLGMIEGSNSLEGIPKSESNSSINSDSNASVKTLEDIYGKERHSSHCYWGKGTNGNKLSQLEEQIAEVNIDKQILRSWNRVSIKDWGTIPGSIKELIQIIIESNQPKVDWRRTLRIFSSSSRKTRIDYTIKRISKRYGTRPGIKIKKLWRMVVAVDVSGSIDNKSIELFFNEIKSMWKSGATITVIECDAKVQKVYEFNGKYPEEIKGRGGTVFDPVFDYINQNRMVRFDGCIYLTDGYADEPKNKPHCRLLWVVTPDGKIGDHLKWGRVVKLPKN